MSGDHSIVASGTVLAGSIPVSVFNKDSIVISCIVLEKISVHLVNALAMFALSCRHRISSCAKRNQDQRWPPSLYNV